MITTTHRDKVIHAATVPRTPVTITVTRRAVRRSETSQCLTATYVVERRPNGARFVNYLSCGRDSLAEARAEANYLWADTVKRRDDYTVVALQELASVDPSAALYRAEVELSTDRFFEFVTWMADNS